MKNKCLNLCQIIMHNADYFDNFVGKLQFSSMSNFHPNNNDTVIQEELNIQINQSTLYLIDTDESLSFITSLLNKDCFAIPMYYHMWHNNGYLGSTKEFNTIINSNIYQEIGLSKHEYKAFAMLFDGKRIDEVNDANKYDNTYEIFDEYLPNLAFLNKIGISKVVLIYDKKNFDMITTATNLYDDNLELVNIMDLYEKIN